MKSLNHKSRFDPLSRINMSVILALLSFSCLVFFPFRSQAGDLTENRPLAQTLKVGVHQNPPSVFKDEAGKPAELHVDKLNEIARREGGQLEYVLDTRIVLPDKMKKGELDLLFSNANSQKRIPKNEVPIKIKSTDNEMNSTIFKPLYTFGFFLELHEKHTTSAYLHRFIRAVASDLNIDIVAYFAEGDRVLYHQQMTAALTGKDLDKKVDGIIYMNIKKQDKRFLDTIEAHKTPAMLNICGIDYQKVGRPREIYRYLVGQVLQDEVQIGYDLAKSLIDEALRRKLTAKDGKVHFFAIAGNSVDLAGVDRVKGLDKALSDYADKVVFHQRFHSGNWSADEARILVRTGLKRYPETTVIWGASDDICMGIVSAVKKAGKQSGRDILTGSVDGTLEIVKKVASGEVHCTYSGLFMHSGWATILLYDYLHGIDFREDSGVVVNIASEGITRERAEQILSLISDYDWERIDFTRFSKVHNRELQNYDFSWDAVLQQLKRDQK